MQLSLADLIIWQTAPIYLRIGQYVRPFFVLIFFPSVRQAFWQVKVAMKEMLQVLAMILFVMLFFSLFFVIMFKDRYVHNIIIVKHTNHINGLALSARCTSRTISEVLLVCLSYSILVSSSLNRIIIAATTNLMYFCYLQQTIPK